MEGVRWDVILLIKYRPPPRHVGGHEAGLGHQGSTSFWGKLSLQCIPDPCVAGLAGLARVLSQTA